MCCARHVLQGQCKHPVGLPESPQTFLRGTGMRSDTEGLLASHGNLLRKLPKAHHYDASHVHVRSAVGSCHTPESTRSDTVVSGRR